MKSAAIFVLLAVLSACVSPPVSDVKARASIYKIHLTETLDTTSIDQEIRTDLGIPNSVEVGYTGTGWVVSSKGSSSFIMTAGHLCMIKGDKFDAGMFGELTISSVKFRLEDANGVFFDGASVILDDDKVDLCMLGVQGDLGEALPISDEDPTYGDRARFLGAPAGVWGGGIVPIAEGIFAGRGNPFGGTDPYLTFTMFAAGGASGSPIIAKGRVVAVLVAGSTRYRNLFVGVPHEIMKDFIKRAFRV